MWHASAASAVLNRRHLRGRARAMLAGVGDCDAGEWLDVTRRGRLVTVHYRRRLTAAEALVSGPVEDIRGTREHGRIAAEISQAVPLDAEALVAWELGPTPPISDRAMIDAMMHTLRMVPRVDAAR